MMCVACFGLAVYTAAVESMLCAIYTPTTLPAVLLLCTQSTALGELCLFCCAVVGSHALLIAYSALDLSAEPLRTSAVIHR